MARRVSASSLRIMAILVLYLAISPGAQRLIVMRRARGPLPPACRPRRSAPAPAAPPAPAASQPAVAGAPEIPRERCSCC
jgi:hypothetical protein